MWQEGHKVTELFTLWDAGSGEREKAYASQTALCRQWQGLHSVQAILSLPWAML